MKNPAWIVIFILKIDRKESEKLISEIEKIEKDYNKLSASGFALPQRKEDLEKIKELTKENEHLLFEKDLEIDKCSKLTNELQQTKKSLENFEKIFNELKEENKKLIETNFETDVKIKNMKENSRKIKSQNNLLTEKIKDLKENQKENLEEQAQFYFDQLTSKENVILELNEEVARLEFENRTLREVFLKNKLEQRRIVSRMQKPGKIFQL